jgi:signal transduction histidine kinase
MNKHTLRSSTDKPKQQLMHELRESQLECERLRSMVDSLQKELNRYRLANNIEHDLLEQVASDTRVKLARARDEVKVARHLHRGEREQFRLFVDQKTKEFALLRLQNERILQNIPVGIAFLDKNLVCRWVNQAFSQVAGLPVEKIINRPFFETFPEIENEFGELVRSVIQQSRSQAPVSLPFIHSAGGVDPSTQWDFLALPTLGENNEIDGILIAIEVTAKLELERVRNASLTQLDQLKGDFINMISHELRTPLTTIAGYAEFLEDDLGGELSPDQHGYVAKIQEAESRIRGIVDDLLDFARLDAGTFLLQVEATDLLALIRDLVLVLVPTCQTANVITDLDTQLVDCFVKADSKRVSQVLLNLIGNAIKFTPAGGHVSISVVKTETDVTVLVRDTGIGIDVDHQAHLFEKFYQVDRSTTREYGGAGIGLAISRMLIEKQGGKMGVESQLGGGSTFWFTLPVYSEEHDAKVPTVKR